jgi:hypothetical protein
MDLSVALHTAVRRFCANQHYRWSLEYMPLCKAGLDRVGSGYSEAAYALFPRYRLDEAIEVEVERLTGMEFPSLEKTREMLIEAGACALSILNQEFQYSSLACVSLRDEFETFELYVKGLDPAQLSSIEPLPYRRVLRNLESKELREKLRTTWGASGYWYPLAKCAPDTNVIAFHEELWKQRKGAALLVKAMQERAVDRCFLLREGPTDYELDRALMDPIYSGDESFATSDFEWLVYSSHESSISVAGWMADFFRMQWPDWESITYEGCFHTDNLRGSWNMP